MAPTFVNGVHTLTVGSSSFSTVPPAGVALNISTRLPVGLDQNVLIGGFIIQGPAPKTIVLRAIGPTLTDFGIAGALADPTLELFQGNTSLARNDTWRTTQIGGIITSNQSIDLLATTIPPSKDAESAMVVTLDPGSYTAVVRGANNTTGVAVVEGYDIDPDKTSTLANVSTRGFVQGSGNNGMIGGFIYGGGPGATNVVVRGIGPSLAPFGISNALSDPMLELRDANGTIVDSNDDWISNRSKIPTGLQPSKDVESAILVTGLAPGGYTALLQGKAGETGVGVVEVYIFP
jgi:hypothetical protein